MTDDIPRGGWSAVAREAARLAHEDHFERRRGTLYLADAAAVVVFDNNPPYDGMTARDGLLARVRSKFSALGVGERAAASYPIGGPDDGYTVALVLDAGWDREEDVSEALWQAVDESI